MKTIRQITWSLTALLLVLLVACQPEEPSLEVMGSTSFDLESEGGSCSVSLTTNYAWDAQASDPWIHVSPTSGEKGSATLTILADANDTGKARSGAVTVNCQTLRQTIKISQKANLAQSLLIRHDNSSFSIPVLTGSGIQGKVNWGDGAEESYASSLQHTYSSAGSHLVTLQFNGATGFELKSIAGVSEIAMKF